MLDGSSVLDIVVFAIKNGGGATLVTAILLTGFLFGVVYAHKTFASKTWVKSYTLSKIELKERDKEAIALLVSKDSFDGGVLLINTQLLALKEQVDKLDKLLIEFISRR